MPLSIQVLWRALGYVLCFVSIAGMCGATTQVFLWARTDAKFPWKQPFIFILWGMLFVASIQLVL